MMRAGKDYGVEVIVAYEQRRVGQVFFPPALLRDRLIRSGRVKLVQPPSGDLLEGVSGGQASSNDDAAGSRKKSARNLNK